MSARVGLGARLWFVSARLGFARGVIEAAVKRRCGKKVRKVANL